MRKVLHFDTPPEVYTADACAVTCYDARFDPAIRKFFKRRGLSLVDQVKIPGAAKGLSGANGEAERDFALGMVRVSLALHRAPLVVLVGHNDCGGYSGAAPVTIAADLLKAAEFLRGAEPRVRVECYFADFDGIYEVG
jgi:hypothetical protein